MVSTAVLVVLLGQVLNVVHCATSKKGVVMIAEDYRCGDFDALNDITYWYDYTANLANFASHDTCTPNIYNIPAKNKFVPMIWSDDWGIPTFEPSANYILGFNEPNHFSQANMTPSEATSSWPPVVSSDPGKTFIAPAPAQCGSGCNAWSAKDWYTGFNPSCGANACFNYLATHTYMCDIPTVMGIIDDLYLTFGYQIWLTEFACVDLTDPWVMKLWMQMIVPLLDASPNVATYFWYLARPGPTTTYVNAAVGLLENNTATLTPLGAWYNGYQGGSVTVDDPALHNFNEADTPFKTLTGVFKEEAMLVLLDYDLKPKDWSPILSKMAWSLKEMKPSAQAFYIYNYDAKAAQKTRIRNFFNIIMCATQAQINDAEVWAEVVRINNMDETVYEEKKGRLKVPTC